MRLLQLILALLLTCLSRSGSALEPDRALHHHVRQTWSIEQGLPQVGVSTLAQDSLGYLWVGSQSSLARFDGLQFTSFTPATHPGLPGLMIRALHPGRDGQMWIGTQKGLALFDGLRFHPVPIAGHGSVHPDVTGLSRDARGAVWVASTTGLWRVEGGRLQPVPGSPGRVQGLLAREDGLWVGSQGATYRYADGEWTRQTLPARSASVRINGLVEAQGRLWAATTHGVFHYVEGAWHSYPHLPQFEARAVELLAADHDGNLWVGGDAGLARVRNGVTAEFVPADAPGGVRTPRAALEDREGNLWIGSQLSGLIRLTDSWIRRYGTVEGLHEANVWSVAPDTEAGRIWVGTSDGVALFDGRRFTRVVPGAALPHPHAYNLYAESARLWIGTRGGVAVLDLERPGSAAYVPAALEPMIGTQVHGFVRDREGALWMPTDAGLYRLRTSDQNGDRLDRFGPAEGLEDPRLGTVLLTRDGRLFAGGQAGVFEMRQGRLHRIGLEEGLDATDVTAMTELADGRLVVGTLLERLYVSGNGQSGPRWHRLDAEHGMPANAPFAMVEAAGQLWIGGIRGITRVPLRDLDAFVEGRIARVDGEMLLSDRGEPGRGQQGYCCNGYGTGKGFVRDGTFWLPTRDGIVSMALTGIERNSRPPTVVIENAHWGDAWHPAQWLRGRELPADARDLAFSFSVLSLQDPDSNASEYRLRGYDRSWRAAGPLERTTRYTNLPPGHYVFEVRGRNNAGVASVESAELAFSIRPYPHETRAFAIAAALALAVLAYAGFRWQRRRHGSQRQALEALVRERTLALELANRRLEEASDTDPLTGLRNRRYVANQIPADLAYYDRQLVRGELTADVLLFALVDVDGFKRINDRYGHHGGDLVLQQLAQLLSGQVRTGDYVARWSGDQFLLVFRPMALRSAATLGERLRQVVAAHGFEPAEGGRETLTCSIGLAEYPLFRDERASLGWEAMVELAERAIAFVRAHGGDGWAAFRPTASTDMARLMPALQDGVRPLLDRGHLQVVGRVGGRELSIT